MAPVISFPISAPFAGRTIEPVAKWLKAAADDVDLDRFIFANVLHMLGWM